MTQQLGWLLVVFLLEVLTITIVFGLTLRRFRELLRTEVKSSVTQGETKT